MIKYKIVNPENLLHKPVLHIEQNEYWWLHELNSCDADYILDDILPNLEEIMKGGKYWDPYRSPYCGYLDYYEFGYDATGIDFYKDKSIITYGYNEGKIEVPSEEIYQFMMEWGKYLREWREKQK
jgi:hypothetical protein